MITLQLTTEEVNSLLQVLGDLPTKTGAFMLLMKIKNQAENLPAPLAPTAPADAPAAE